MRAMILAAGRGERMMPLTKETPKPLLHVRGKPLIVWQIERLVKAGFKDIVINIAYLGYKIKDSLGDGSKWGVNIIYSDEQQEGALESAGGIIKALAQFENKPFLVVNADIWCDYRFEKDFDLGDNLAHLILVENPQHNPNGDFGIKDSKAENSADKMFTFSGIAYYSPKMFENIPCTKLPLAPLLREKISQKRVSASIHKGYWYDIGTPQRLDLVNNRI